VVTKGAVLLFVLCRNMYARVVLCCAGKDGSAVAPMMSLDTASMKELDLLSKDIDDLKK